MGGDREMKTKRKTVHLTRQGIDEASAYIEQWLGEASVKRKDLLRVRLTMETLLSTIRDHAAEPVQAELIFVKWLNACWLWIIYRGTRFDPTEPRLNELDELSANLLSRTGVMPEWRWRADRNELRLRIPVPGIRSEIIMLWSLILSVAAGMLGKFIPQAVRISLTDNVLTFLSNGFLNLLNTFIGLMIFLAIITGICGIGSASTFKRIGKLMLPRLIGLSFLMSAGMTLAVRLLFRLNAGTVGVSSQVTTILDMLFQILPSNPIKPFLEGNTLQIVFMGILIGISLLLVGNETEGLRKLIVQAQSVVVRCIMLVCMLLPLYIFSSLLTLFWKDGMQTFIMLWRPLVISIAVSLAAMTIYLAVTCKKLAVRPSVLLPKLLPDYLIGLTTASASVALPTTLEINETQLGIDAAFSRTAVPIGSMLFTSASVLMYIIPCAYLAEFYQVNISISWWIILWFISTLLTMSTPPVPGGPIACLTILITQMQLPQESLAIAVTISMLVDFICSGARILTLHLETALQADKLGLLNQAVLRNRQNP